MSETNFAISIVLRFINYFFPQQANHQINTNQRVLTNLQRNRINRRRRRINRRHHIRTDLNSNFIRAQIIIRARQITAQKRAIASQAEQALVDAILQA
mmetsp:Transcript_25130/g.35989  ORF Transcript_25130/g.35989 Transcript_25130/m.35989 type:complete len:98 (-) Transcript_25130:773-1066(-)